MPVLGLLGCLALGGLWKLNQISEEAKSQEIIRKQKEEVAGTNWHRQLEIVAQIQFQGRLPDGTIVREPHQHIKEACRVARRYITNHENFRWYDYSMHKLEFCVFDKDGYIVSIAGQKVDRDLYIATTFK